MADDDLQEARDNFFVGNFMKTVQLCEAAGLSMDDMAANECNALLGRAHLSLGDMAKLKEFQNSSCPGQKAAAMFAVFQRSPNEQQQEQAKEKLLAIAKETADMSCAALAACILAGDGLWNDSVQMASSHPTLEMQALKVFFLLLCNQPELAEKRLQEASGTNDDSGAYRMAQAAVHLATGNPEEAYLIYCDLSTQFPADSDDSGSLILQTGKAVANMQRGMWAEAAEDLIRVLDAEKPDANVLVNLCTCSIHMAKPDDFERYYGKLAQVAPNHVFVQKTRGISTVFQRVAASQH